MSRFRYVGRDADRRFGMIEERRHDARVAPGTNSRRHRRNERGSPRRHRSSIAARDRPLTGTAERVRLRGGRGVEVKEDVRALRGECPSGQRADAERILPPVIKIVWPRNP